MLVTVIAVLVVFTSFRIFKFYYLWKKYLRTIPKLPNSLVSDLRNISTGLQSAIDYSLKNFNGIFRLSFSPFYNVIVVTHPRYLQKLMTLETCSKSYTFLKDWLGHGLITSDGPQWKSRRRVLAPYFTQVSILKHFVRIFEEYSDVLVEKLSIEISNKSIDLVPVMKMFSMDVICRAAMGVTINCLKDENTRYMLAVEKLCSVAFGRTSPLKKYDFFFRMTQDYKEQLESLKIVDDFFYNIVKKKKEAPISKSDFLDMLLEQGKDGFSLRDIKDEVNTFIFAGHDTSAMTLAFTMYQLAQHPEIQDKILEEQMQIFGNVAEEIEISYSDLQEMKYLELVIYEGLRMFPPVPFSGRKLKTEFQLDEDFTLPPDTHILMFLYGVHHDPKYFPEPERFLPERFEGGKAADFTFLPFSGGLRSCIGKKFALLEMKTCLSKIVRNFILAPSVPRVDLQLSPSMMAHSKNGIPISLQKRIEKNITIH